MIAASQCILKEDDPAFSGPKQLNQNAEVSSLQTFLPSRQLLHHPQAGLNPIVDAAAYFIAALGKVKKLKTLHQIKKIYLELADELSILPQRVQSLDYSDEYILICRYILCAAFDDITAAKKIDPAEDISLLAALKQDPNHHQKFFEILERAMREPALYIDLMELIYICLSMGYQGMYRGSGLAPLKLEQITDTLYKHIQICRGRISKVLSPTPFRVIRVPVKTSSKTMILFKAFIAAACVMMTIFISLGYLMDTLSDEAYSNIKQVERHLLNAYS